MFSRHARPIWAIRILRHVTILWLIFSPALLPSLRCDFGNLFFATFGLFWILLGGFSLSFAWPITKSGGGLPYSPKNKRGIWLMFVFGMIFMGSLCLFSALGIIPSRIAGC